MRISNTAEQYRYPAPHIGPHKHGDGFGFFRIPSPLGGNRILQVVACDAGHSKDGTLVGGKFVQFGRWDHVSVTLVGSQKTPTWDEMCFIKDLFWDPEDTVIQFHPKKSDYVNLHPGCLHLWRNVETDHELPPRYMVGL